MFDSHCHLDFPEFDTDREAVLAHCRQQGMRGILIPGVTAATWPRLLALTDTQPDLYPALGLHPLFVNEHQDADLQLLDQHLAQQRAVAVGEIGLDFYIETLDRGRQQHFFSEQLMLAKKYHLPVILHVRKAHDQVLAQLRRVPLIGGIVHAFSGSEQQAHQYVELGFKLGFGGAMTWPRAKKLQRLASTLPLESIVLETDAPDMSPVWAENRRNSPQYLLQYAQFIAQLRGVDVALIRQQTTKTVRQLLGLP